MEERMAEIDQDMAEKHHITKERSFLPSKQPAVTDRKEKDEDDDGEDDFGDDDDENSEEEEVFGGGTKTIVAES